MIVTMYDSNGNSLGRITDAIRIGSVGDGTLVITHSDWNTSEVTPAAWQVEA